MLRERMQPCHSREAIVMVRRYENGVMEGCLKHPYLEKAEEIKSLSQMVLILDRMLDLEDCPSQQTPMIQRERMEEEGVAIIRIQILFREHYTWQGRLVWQNENQETIFRSAIELLELFDEILAE